LGGGKSNNMVFAIIAKVDIEVVKITPAAPMIKTLVGDMDI